MKVEIEIPDDLHADTASLVKDFAEAMAAKLTRAQNLYGWTNGWLTDSWQIKCGNDFLRHIVKGDPLDCANYLAFMWKRGWPTSELVASGDFSYRLPEKEEAD